MAKQQQYGHIYIYGELQDYLTGELLTDTDDERIRQELARLLVEERGFAVSDLLPRQTIATTFSGRRVLSRIDLVASIKGQPLMLLRCAPGSLVSRERAAVAAARLFYPDYQLPLAVVFNGRDAALLDCYLKKTIATGLDAIPSRNQLEQDWFLVKRLVMDDNAAKERERRILNAFDYEICCLQDS